MTKTLRTNWSALEFLVEEFADVDASTSLDEDTRFRLLRRAASYFLPGGAVAETYAGTVTQAQFIAQSAKATSRLRVETKQWVQAVASGADGRLARGVNKYAQVQIGPLSVHVRTAPRKGATPTVIVEGKPRDVFWYHVTQIIRGAAGRIHQCPAPRVHDPLEFCDRLFLATRKGRRRYCSEQCRARAATRRSRGQF
jgi:hypothetical protein